jgi:hypothetical protein
MIFMSCKNRINKKENKDFLVLTLMYFAASLGVIDREIMSQNNILITRYLVIILGTIYFLNSYRKKYSRGRGRIVVPSKINSWGLMLLWMFFSITVIISQSYNGNLPLEGIVYLIYNPIIFFIVIPKSLNNPKRTIIRASFYSSFSYLIFSVLYQPIVLGWSYSGITYNPNSIGQLAVQASISSFCLLLDPLKNLKLKKRKLLIYLIYFIISITFVFISRSRTSFLALLLSIMIIMFVYIATGNMKFKRFVLAVIAFTTIYFLKLREYLYEGVLDKFSSYRGDTLLTGRDYIWNRIFQEISILGHGSTYFTKEIGIGAHNSIMETIGIFGVIAGIFLFLFYIVSVFVSIKYAFLNRKKTYFYVPLGVVVAFFALSMAESMFGVIGKSMTLVFLNIIGVIMFSEIRGEYIND